MTIAPALDEISDADLVRATIADDNRAFAELYDRYADSLYDFCLGIVRDRDAAADCVQNVFCTAATQLPKLREPEKLRSWLYAIARREALRCVKRRRREEPTDDLPEAVSGDPGPDALAVRSELLDLLGEAARGLSERDRTVFAHTCYHGLTGPEIACVLEISDTHAHVLLHRLRDRVEKSLSALLVARRARRSGQCNALVELVSGWDGKFDIQTRKRFARHIESCSTCDEERRRLVNPAALLGAAPVLIPAPTWLRDQTLHQIQLTCASGVETDPAAAGADAETGNGGGGTGHAGPSTHDSGGRSRWQGLRSARSSDRRPHRRRRAVPTLGALALLLSIVLGSATDIQEVRDSSVTVSIDGNVVQHPLTVSPPGHSGTTAPATPAPESGLDNQSVLGPPDLTEENDSSANAAPSISSPKRPASVTAPVLREPIIRATVPPHPLFPSPGPRGKHGNAEPSDSAGSTGSGTPGGP